MPTKKKIIKEAPPKEPVLKLIRGECVHKECYGNSDCKKGQKYEGIDI